MKLKRKLISLSVAALLCGGFFANGIGVEAGKSLNTANAVKSHTHENKKMRRKKAKRGKRQKKPSQPVEASAEPMQLEKGLEGSVFLYEEGDSKELKLEKMERNFNKCGFTQDKPAVFVGIKDVDKPELSNLSLCYSPTYVRTFLPDEQSFLYSDIIQNLVYEIVDSRGNVYRCFGGAKSMLFPGRDVVSAVLPCVDDIKNGCEGYAASVDENFKVGIGETCVVRFLTSSGKLLFEQEVVAANTYGVSGSRYENVVAHPVKFDRKFYDSYINDVDWVVQKQLELEQKKRNSVSSKNKKALCEEAKSDGIEYLKKFENFYNEKNFSGEGPVFLSRVLVHPTSTEDRNNVDMFLYFSPTMVNKLAGRNFEFSDYILEMVDENGKVYRSRQGGGRCGLPETTYGGMAGDIRGETGDVILAFVFQDEWLLNKSEKKAALANGDEDVVVDDGFKIVVGKSYKIRLLDLEGNVMIEQNCVFNDANKIKPGEIATLIAHPKVFDKAYYLNQLERRERERGSNSKGAIKTGSAKACCGVEACKNAGAVDGSAKGSSKNVKEGQPTKSIKLGMTLEEIERSFNKHKYTHDKPAVVAGMVGAADGDDPESQDLFLIYSPTYVRTFLNDKQSFLYSNIMEDLVYELVDSSGNAFKFFGGTRSLLFPRTDTIMVESPYLSDVRKGRESSNVSVDANFKIRVGENYKIRFLTSNGELLFEQEVVVANFDGVRSKEYKNMVAHPNEFDRKFYGDLTTSYELVLGRMLERANKGGAV